MGSGRPSWDPASSSSWAKLLGMVHVPLFAPTESVPIPGDHAVLLDGPEASFAFFATSDGDNRLSTDDTLLSWAWSAHLRHALIVDPQIERMFLRRWDAPSLIRQFTLPQRGLGAEDLLSILQAAPPPGTPTVIQHVLHGFRLIRHELRAHPTLEAIKLLNVFLLAANTVRKGHIEREAFLAAKAFGDVIAALPAGERTLAQVDDFPQSLCAKQIGVLAHHFLDPEQMSGCELHSDLLFRHAASQLYQEAHLEVERDPQGTFPGLAPVDAPSGHLSKDVRYTPVNLARALVQQALLALGSAEGRATPLVVLDPACGSGIFLQECLRELAQTGTGANVRLVGYDRSPLAAYIARFCLRQAMADLPGCSTETQFAISEQDALQGDWPQVDLVLMNPPFTAWQALDPERRDTLQGCLGALCKRRPDIAMGFLFKGVNALKPGGVVASVLPAALLGNESGIALRERLGKDVDIVLLGRFEGYRYFADSLVEPAFVVLRRKTPGAQPPPPVRVLIAEERAEDSALRLLRMAQIGQRASDKRVDLFATRTEHFGAKSWLPERRSVYHLRELLKQLKLPTVGQLFRVAQGARTGNNPAFVLRSDCVEGKLPPPERRFFRPVAGQGTIASGRLVPRFQVFYPYGPDGLAIASEPALAENLPEYSAGWLRDRKNSLQNRAGVSEWWALTRPREWQYGPAPKLVSTYFGAAGSFAYDDQGHYVVVQGSAWLWKPGMAPRGVLDVQVYLNGTELPWAYLALLNSGLFARVLACYCPRVQGGQFNLSQRFVKSVPIPDLSDPQAPCAGVLPALAELGRRIHIGQLSEVAEEAQRLSARAYGLPDDF